jgi:phage N-6-adenine-methyltransferase
MNTKLHFSSATIECPTEQAFFDKCNLEYGPFTLDPCSTHENAKCDNHFTIQEDGLSQTWRGKVWMNPPYGRTISYWMEKAYMETLNGNAEMVACLVPSRTDTKWWHEYAMKGEVHFIRGRLKFGEHHNSAPFPSALVIFRSS